jgi:hypothetical protein
LNFLSSTLHVFVSCIDLHILGSHMSTSVTTHSSNFCPLHIFDVAFNLYNCSWMETVPGTLLLPTTTYSPAQ